MEGHRKVISVSHGVLNLERHAVSHFHRLLFNHIIAKKMQKEELFCKNRETVSYHLTSQKRLQEVFSFDDGFTFGKRHQNEDIIIIGPWGCLVEDLTKERLICPYFRGGLSELVGHRVHSL